MSNKESLINSAWEASLGGLGWLKSVLIDEFENNRPISAIEADMLVSFYPVL